MYNNQYCTYSTTTRMQSYKKMKFNWTYKVIYVFFCCFCCLGGGFGTSFVPVRYCNLKCRYLGTKHVKNKHEHPMYVEKLISFVCVEFIGILCI